MTWNSYKEVLANAQDRLDTWYRRRAKRIKAFYASHPENLHPVKEVTYTGEIIRDYKAPLINVELLCVAGWWDLIEAGPMEKNHDFDNGFPYYDNYKMPESTQENINHTAKTGKFNQSNKQDARRILYGKQLSFDW